MTTPTLAQLQADAAAISVKSPAIRQFALDAVAYLQAQTASLPYFVGDFQTGDLSQWSDFHDAQLAAAPPGFAVVGSPAPPGLTHSARVSVQQFASSSTASGDAAYLWEGGGYNLPWLGRGSDVWFRTLVAFPDGTSAAFPGVFTHSPVSSGWDMFLEWHSAPGAGYSSYVGVWGSSPLGLIFRPAGGSVPAQSFEWIHEQAGGADKALQFNHWYEIVVHFLLDPSPSVGLAEWWVDGVEQYSAHVPTLTTAADGTVPALSLQTGLYRGPSRTDMDTIYLAGLKAGPTRASVGA